MEVVLALGAGGGVADFLHGRQEQADQDGDDGNHHQQLNQGETALPSPPVTAEKLDPRPEAWHDILAF
jgi:hypothetical protein